MSRYSSEQIYALLHPCDDEDNLMNDIDTEFIAEEEIAQAARTQDSSLSTLKANLHAVPSHNQSKKNKKKREQKRRIMEMDQKSKSYQAGRMSPSTRNTT